MGLALLSCVSIEKWRENASKLDLIYHKVEKVTSLRHVSI
jgi:hypothetical protein